MSLPEAQVRALAPDAASLEAAERHTRPAAWRNLGHDPRALWGEVVGRAPYQVVADLTDLGTKCSCPSRKLPCKHALGLLLARARQPAAVPVRTAPDWVEAWLARRAAHKRRTEARAASGPDLVGRVRRAVARERRVDAGVEALEQWLDDVARTGLAGLAVDGAASCTAQAARLADAQAPGLASRVRRIGEAIGQGTDWPEQVAHELGRLALLARAWRRRAALDEPLVTELSQLLGFTVTEASVRELGVRATDRWCVVGQRVEEDERLKSARTWLWGRHSERCALVLEFALPTARFTEPFAVGTTFEGELCWYPGAVARRALVTARSGEPAAMIEPWRGHPTLAAMLDAHALLLARQPWLERMLALVDAVVPVRAPDGRLWARDAAGQALPLELAEPLTLLAVSGGHPVSLACEWDGAQLHPLGAWAEGAYQPLGGVA